MYFFVPLKLNRICINIENLQAMKKLEELKNKVMNWSGFQLEGNTKLELKKSVSEIGYKLECEISDQVIKFDRLINALEIEERY